MPTKSDEQDEFGELTTYLKNFGGADRAQRAVMPVFLVHQGVEQADKEWLKTKRHCEGCADLQQLVAIIGCVDWIPSQRDTLSVSMR